MKATNLLRKTSYEFLFFQGITVLDVTISSLLASMILLIISKNLDFVVGAFILCYGITYPLIICATFILFGIIKNNKNFSKKYLLIIAILTTLPYLFLIPEALQTSFLGIAPILGLLSITTLGYPVIFLFNLLPCFIWRIKNKKEQSDFLSILHNYNFLRKALFIICTICLYAPIVYISILILNS